MRSGDGQSNAAASSTRGRFANKLFLWEMLNLGTSTHRSSPTHLEEVHSWKEKQQSHVRQKREKCLKSTRSKILRRFARILLTSADRVLF